MLPSTSANPRIRAQRSFYGIKKSELIDGIIKISKERLSRSQRLMLFEIWCIKAALNSTRFVYAFSEKFGSSKSAVWQCFNSLKRMGLLDTSQLKGRERKIKLSSFGKVVADGFRDDKSTPEKYKL